MMTHLKSRSKCFSLEKPGLVGVLNLTPDSFSDGGLYQEVPSALARARQMLAEGADWLDLGGESSGPGSLDVSLAEELRRILPVLEAFRAESQAWVSVDTAKAEVARQALRAGADAINDVTALRGEPAMAEVVAEAQVPIILMYSKDQTPRTTPEAREYQDLFGTLQAFFEERLRFAESAGISREQVILDPGMGAFVSTRPDYSFEILRRLPQIVAWGYPVLIGTSRKSFLAGVTPGRTLSVNERLIPSLVTSAWALWQGACLIRLHDIAEGRLMRDTLEAIRRETAPIETL